MTRILRTGFQWTDQLLASLNEAPAAASKGYTSELLWRVDEMRSTHTNKLSCVQTEVADAVKRHATAFLPSLTWLTPHIGRLITRLGVTDYQFRCRHYHAVPCIIFASAACFRDIVPGCRAKYYLSVCLSVCLFFRSHILGNTHPHFQNFLCALPVTVVALRCIVGYLRFCVSRWRHVSNKLSPRGRRDGMSTADGSSTRGGSTSVRDGSAVRTSLVVGQLQAASVRIA